jgi:hypothetical protein
MSIPSPIDNYNAARDIPKGDYRYAATHVLGVAATSPETLPAGQTDVVLVGQLGVTQQARETEPGNETPLPVPYVPPVTPIGHTIVIPEEKIPESPPGSSVLGTPATTGAPMLTFAKWSAKEWLIVGAIALGVFYAVRN